MWLFAVAFALNDIPAGTLLTLACTYENDSPANRDAGSVCEPSPATDDEHEPCDNEVGNIMPLIDPQESQFVPGDAEVDDISPADALERQAAASCVQDGISIFQDPCPQPANVGIASSRKPPASTWKAVMGDVPCPVDWASAVKSCCPGLEKIVCQLNASSRPLRVGTPCAGFEAPVFALRGLGVTNFERTFALDIDPIPGKFGRALDAALGTSPQCHWFGRREGDILERPLDEFPSVDLLIAGPPCTPWSRYGRRAGQDDPRARVFWRIIDLIGCLAGREAPDALQCFLLENTSGILEHDAHHRRGIDEVLQRLGCAVPCFDVSVLRVNSKNHSLPQSRPRVYIVGVRRDRMLAGKSIDEPEKHPVETHFPDWLVPWDKTPPHFLEIPARLVSKKRKWDQHLDERDRQAQSRGKERWLAANANIERDRDNRWAASARLDGMFGTITRSDRLWLWVRPPPQAEPSEAEGSAASLAAQRYVMPVEALGMQGFPTKDPLLVAALQDLSCKLPDRRKDLLNFQRHCVGSGAC